MKYLFIGLFVLISLVVASIADAQSLRADLNISPHPSMRLSDWSSLRETVTLTIFNTSDKNASIRIDAKLSLNGSLIAQTKVGQMPVLIIPAGGSSVYFASDLFPENAVSFLGDLKQSTMRSGILPEGNYELCITLIGALNMQPLNSTACRTFSLQKNIMPVLLQPEDNKKIISGTENTTLFVWTPMIPAQSSVNYRLRIVEVLAGQSAQQAFAVNNPLFERTTMSTTFLWPQEIPLPQTGSRLAWGIQPEDDQSNPLILPERFTNVFNLIALPTRDECQKILEKIKKLRNDGLRVEEEYWQADAKFQRTSEFFEAAQERADALDIEKWKHEMQIAERNVNRLKAAFDVARAKYDTAITEYENCGK
jgi:hypothetical protein